MCPSWKAHASTYSWIPSKISFHSLSCCSIETACSLVRLPPAASTAFLPSIYGEMKVGSPPETSLHWRPIVRKDSIAPLVARLISPLMYQPPKLSYLLP